MTLYGIRTFLRNDYFRGYKEKLSQWFNRPRIGRCADCGETTARYDYTYNWFICAKHDSDAVGDGT